MATAPVGDSVDIEQVSSETEDVQIDDQSTEYDISIYPSDFTLQGLYDKWRSGSIRLPEFQRKYIWNRQKASRLVESFLLGLPVPSIFLYQERDTAHQLVIDGHQRLFSVFYYFEGNFSNGMPFRLTKDIHQRWQNRSFEELEDQDKLKLQDSVLRATVVRQLHPNDDTSIFHIFERLNTANTPLTSQEIRNCIYHGNFNKLLNEINQYMPSWRKIVGKENPDARQRDVELILRILALSQEVQNYKKPMKDFLNSFMDRNRMLDDSKLIEYRNLFRHVTEKIVEHLGPKPFHIHSGLNASVLDSVSVAFTKHLDDIPEDIEERYNLLVENIDFRSRTTTGTTDVKIVHERMKIAERDLFNSPAK